MCVLLYTRDTSPHDLCIMTLLLQPQNSICRSKLYVMEILPTCVVRINGQAEKKLIENVSLLQQPITMYSQVSVGEINPIVDD